MLEQELKNIWNRASEVAHISIETSQLLEELNAKMSRIQKVIRKRDIREIAASVFGIVIFSYLLFEIPFPITRMACIMSIIWFAYVIFKFQNSKKQQLGSHLNLSIRRQLLHQKNSLLYQVDLLKSGVYWYAIPPFIINCIFLYGLGNPADYNWTNSLFESILPLSNNLKMITIIGLTIFYSLIVLINKRAANKGLKPIFDRIEIIESQL